jgi:hypothetical protein
VKASNDLIEELLAGLVPQTGSGETERASSIQPNDRLGHTMVSTADFAAMLGTSHEFARRLVAASGHGIRIPRGGDPQKRFWRISRTWAEKFVRLRKAFRPAEDRQNPRKDNQEYEWRPYLDLSVVHSDGAREVFHLNEHDLEVLTAIWGPLPLVLDLEDASVLRAITRWRLHPNPTAMQALAVFARRMTLEAANAMEKAVPKPEARWWNEKLAELIERTGRVEVSLESK